MLYWLICTATSLFILLTTGVMLTSCTFSYQTICTHGTATDLVDENQTPSTTASPDITIPVKPL